ncbi:MAG: 1,2-phenylacetyl-CoA epoxidase subunit PaaE [Brumimicrobium sp.]|nr:1,2-phenylacetyl-CoA epoxidase subunit PaaE [Brumimicrobium sp.]
MNPTFFELEIADIRNETEDTVSVAFEVPEDLKDKYIFKPGQYLTFKKKINGEDLRRSYSICTSPLENELRVAIKKVPNGRFSTFANEQLKSGDKIEVMTPTGNFTTSLDAKTDKSFVFFAAGSGITPVMSLIKSILTQSPKSDVTLFYGNKGIDSVIFREELESLKNQFMNNFRLIHVFSRESIGNKLQKGRLDEEKIELLYKAFLDGQSVDEVFVCGPEPIIFAVKESFEKLGFDKNKVHFELFTTPVRGEKKEHHHRDHEQQQLNANVKVILDGEQTLLQLDSAGESILEAAQKAGADVPFACKGGVCCTCKAKILEGSAKMDVNYALEEDEVEAGYILTCQAHPTSEQLVVSYDD